MTRTIFLRLIFSLITLSYFNTTAMAQADPIERTWFKDDKTAKINIYKATDGRFYGKVTWLKVPLKDGQPKTDLKNPDKNHRNDPIIGLIILKKFKKADGGHYEDGTIYDPLNGKTYSCIMTLKDNKLEVRGYVGFSLLGRSTTWTVAD